MAGTLRTRAGGLGSEQMEEHSVFVETHGSIAPIECSECDGEAHVFRRAPYPFEGLEFRTFECLECGGQMERITPSETTSLVPT
jgi:hypothetical protein